MLSKQVKTVDINPMLERITDASEMLKAMSNPTRLMILCALSDKELSVNELVAFTKQSPSSVSQHLAKLRAANLVSSRRDAQTIYYACTRDVARQLVEVLCQAYGNEAA